MGRRTALPKFQVFKDADTDTDPESVVTEVTSVDNITYEIDIDPTVDADLEVLFCNDKILTNSSEFKPLDFKQTLSLDGATEGMYMVNVKNIGFKFLKLSIINNGGTGDINAWVTGTVEGA